jgi:hypothetical protein
MKIPGTDIMIPGTDIISIEGSFTTADMSTTISTFFPSRESRDHSWQIGPIDAVSQALEISDEDLTLKLTSSLKQDREYAEAVLKLKKQLVKLLKGE